MYIYFIRCAIHLLLHTNILLTKHENDHNAFYFCMESIYEEKWFLCCWSQKFKYQFYSRVLYPSRQFYISVPSGTPGNVVAVTISPTSVNVSWDQLPNNGTVIAYEVRYSWPLGNRQWETIYVNTSSGATNQLVLNSLQECVQYDISVRYYTSQGPGPFSGGVLDSSLNSKFTMVFTACICILIHCIMTHSLCSGTTTTRSSYQCPHCNLCQSYLELSSGKELYSHLIFC